MLYIIIQLISGMSSGCKYIVKTHKVVYNKCIIL